MKRTVDTLGLRSNVNEPLFGNETEINKSCPHSFYQKKLLTGSYANEPLVENEGPVLSPLVL